MDWKEMQNEGKSRGYWATPSEIQNRIKEREKNKRRDSLIILGVVVTGMILLLGLVFLLI
jgi:uncharacterized Fe-S cluster-containing radical SAM superfamily protein|tara:strand:- start:241 stop:420 length:180 start_codon:yes stop_codon:yes gene_type:complete